jgi:hypothetical protein
LLLIHVVYGVDCDDDCASLRRKKEKKIDHHHTKQQTNKQTKTKTSFLHPTSFLPSTMQRLSGLKLVGGLGGSGVIGTSSTTTTATLIGCSGSDGVVLIGGSHVFVRQRSDLTYSKIGVGKEARRAAARRKFPLPFWIANDPELSRAQKQDYYRSLQFFGGKDPLTLLLEHSKDMIKWNATARNYHLTDTIKSEIYRLNKEDPVTHNESALAIQFRLKRDRISAIVLLKKREEKLKAAGELPDPELSSVLDQELTLQLGPQIDNRAINDAVLLRQNVVSRPRASNIPAEANPRSMARLFPKPSLYNTWKDQLPKDWREEPQLHTPPTGANSDWDSITPLRSPVLQNITAKRPTTTSDKVKDKTITRKLGHAFQNVNPKTGKVSKASIDDAIRFMKAYRPLRKGDYQSAMEKNVEPLPEELEREKLKAEMHPDLLHLSRFFRALTEEGNAVKAWNEGQERILLSAESVAMLDGSENYDYLQYVKKPVLSTDEDPEGSRTVLSDDNTRENVGLLSSREALTRGKDTTVAGTGEGRKRKAKKPKEGEEAVVTTPESGVAIGDGVVEVGKPITDSDESSWQTLTHEGEAPALLSSTSAMAAGRKQKKVGSSKKFNDRDIKERPKKSRSAKLMEGEDVEDTEVHNSPSLSILYHTHIPFLSCFLSSVSGSQGRLEGTIGGTLQNSCTSAPKGEGEANQNGKGELIVLPSPIRLILFLSLTQPNTVEKGILGRGG